MAAINHYYAAAPVFITRMRRPGSILALLTALAALAPATAGAQGIERSRLLWATLNICDTAKSPDTVGVRASMPGSGRKGERMYMRFRAQYFSEVDNRWHNFLAEGLDSGHVEVGSARTRARQSGWSFPFRLEPGQRFELRAVVEFQWRRGRRVVRRIARRTRGGHRTTVADPKNYSAATCVLTG